MKKLIAFLPLLILVGAITAAYIFGLHEYLSLDKIKEQSLFQYCVLVWTDIEVRENIDDVVFLHVSLIFEPNTIIPVQGNENNDTIIITVDNAEYFNRDVVIGIPTEVVNMTSAKKIRKALSVSSEFPDGVNEPDITTPVISDNDPHEQPITEKQAKVLLLQARNPTGIKH